VKISKMINEMAYHKLKLPKKGTGKNGRILARDLETVLGDYFLDKKYLDNPKRKEHCLLRRSMTPMKAARYIVLPAESQEAILADSNRFFAEEKYNGWRIIVTYFPESGFCFWGGNISSKDFLPVDYTDHILFKKVLNYFTSVKYSFVLDGEVLCFDQVETLEGNLTNNTLESVGAILGSDSDRAIQLQENGATLTFKFFDFLNSSYYDPQQCVFNQTLDKRISLLAHVTARLNELDSSFSVAERVYSNKKRCLHKLWNEGKEGVIIKDMERHYAPGKRLATHAVKIKRTMSGEIGDDIDVFISGFILTPEHSKMDLIGGVELSIYLVNDKSEERIKHIIAVVTNIPDRFRELLTSRLSSGEITLDTLCLGKVVVVDGQELSSRNKKLMHAKVDWKIGFRDDKSADECILNIKEITGVKF